MSYKLDMVIVRSIARHMNVTFQQYSSLELLQELREDISNRTDINRNWFLIDLLIELDFRQQSRGLNPFAYKIAYENYFGVSPSQEKRTTPEWQLMRDISLEHEESHDSCYWIIKACQDEATLHELWIEEKNKKATKQKMLFHVELALFMLEKEASTVLE